MGSKKNKKRRNPDCPHCRTGDETFRYSRSVYKFDVDMAREFASDGREPIELEREDVEFSVESTHIYPDHIQHVDPQFPGIIAQMWYPEPDGSVSHGNTLIDGHHRAARCLQDDLPYFVYLLSEAESQQILIKGPDRQEAEEIASRVQQPCTS